mmetsp:Transcript_2214/g.4820  ORF Transcript_2214/g.4820 Transcript_2214/m.4820 type:complete len:439 (-) Transcript_2214:367-1683(-)
MQVVDLLAIEAVPLVVVLGVLDASPGVVLPRRRCGVCGSGVCVHRRRWSLAGLKILLQKVLVPSPLHALDVVPPLRGDLASRDPQRNVVLSLGDGIHVAGADEVAEGHPLHAPATRGYDALERATLEPVPSVVAHLGQGRGRLECIAEGGDIRIQRSLVRHHRTARLLGLGRRRRLMVGLLVATTAAGVRVRGAVLRPWHCRERRRRRCAAAILGLAAGRRRRLGRRLRRRTTPGPPVVHVQLLVRQRVIVRMEVVLSARLGIDHHHLFGSGRASVRRCDGRGRGRGRRGCRVRRKSSAGVVEGEGRGEGGSRRPGTVVVALPRHRRCRQRVGRLSRMVLLLLSGGTDAAARLLLLLGTGRQTPLARQDVGIRAHLRGQLGRRLLPHVDELRIRTGPTAAVIVAAVLILMRLLATAGRRSPGRQIKSLRLGHDRRRSK